MTIMIPDKTIGDRILELLNRRRACYCGEETQKMGPFSTSVIHKEPFLKALLLPRNRNLKKGWCFLDQLRVEE